MRTRWTKVACILAGVASVAGAASGQAIAGQAMLAGTSMTAASLDGGSADFPDSKPYAEGKKAIQEGRWADAVAIFARLADQGGSHADSALYWKAYAQNKLGEADSALATCEELRKGFASSSWSDDCGALEIEIHASTGKPLPPKADQSDELKLLALAALMHKDPQAATDQIKEIVQGDGSEKLKEGAVFILGEQVPDATYPQIVRISYLEGDVRLARASENEKSNKPMWETAVMNVPLNEGDSIATGKDGRVEIEFEDASTIYLAENSVLNSIDMHTTGGVPRTELALVSGTVTTHLDSLMGGETFLLRTPTVNMLTRYPEKSNVRITSYLDGIGVTPLSLMTLNVTGANKVDLVPGKTVFFSEEHHPSTTEEAGKTEDFAAFDAWVADRYSGRKSATAELMKDAGLAKPIPGLADMKGKGHFFECPPYGACWEPDGAQSNAVLAAPAAPAQTPKSARPSAGMAPAGSAGQSAWFPCLSSWYPGTMVNYTGNPSGYLQNPGAFYYGVDPYAWAVCHSGWWVPYNNNYAWVPGLKRHHHCPVRWVKFGRTTALVPLHPKDVKGKPPVNQGHGFVPLKGKDGMRLTPIRFPAGRPLQVVKSAPREFRNAPRPVLTRVDAPRMAARALHDNTKAGVTAHTAIPMSFNHQQGFVTSQQVMHGSHPVAVNVPVGRVGGAPTSGFAHMSGGFSRAGGFSWHSGGVGFGALSHGGGFAGGGRAGGGSLNGGGGGHVGGGGGVSVGGGASSASASSTAASSSGSHK